MNDFIFNISLIFFVLNNESSPFNAFNFLGRDKELREKRSSAAVCCLAITIQWPFKLC